MTGKPSATEAAKQAWLERELAKAPRATQEQQDALRRVLLPPKSLRRPA